MDAVTVVCGIMKMPAPTNDDPLSAKARSSILEGLGFTLIPNPEKPEAGPVVKYGAFLEAFRVALEKSPLASTNPHTKSDELVKKQGIQVKTSDLTIEEIYKVMDQNLPKYYRSTTDAFLKIKPRGGVLQMDDFARFMRSINLNLPEEKLRLMFDRYDVNKNGGLDAWEFIESFGPSINGHFDTSTSLFMGGKSKKKEGHALKEVQLNAEQTRDVILERLPFHYKSSTKAFLAAKVGEAARSRNHQTSHPPCSPTILPPCVHAHFLRIDCFSFLSVCREE